MHPFAVFLACFYFGIRHLFSLIFLYTSSVLNICFRFRLYIFCFASSEVKFGGHPILIVHKLYVSSSYSIPGSCLLYLGKKILQGPKTEQDCFNCT